ncbi:GNAT family N-acetyltransferase [Chengkuizengella axinellae]|uniref:GNAT family N-acetyltransferase n=1 Tax=Chengkuizengella axinellae TaxID=3064388 RepID=A0ABT9J4Q1_9BACL|nr:GNAT family N-acetyltransferase [Chengkuizengella sp. 2205SS18-9]MDP5276610.1 GNAT family N-acetyltransferase [Chengkuizengella sp. 2205SS18-9]
MIYELHPKDFKKIKPLLNGLEKNPVINGVIDGNNLGRIYVDQIDSPKAALVWVKMELFYLIGISKNSKFNSFIEQFIIQNIKPEALEIGDDCLNLELYPFDLWNSSINDIFKSQLIKGERVPFQFQKECFCYAKCNPIPSEYQVLRMDQNLMGLDEKHIIREEIKKFWNSLETFFENGFGYCVIKDDEVVGTCISVFVCKDEYEIGINTYHPRHRGKGLATAMASEFIKECLEKGITPHWTTEHFRKDSIAIANKLGFKQLPNYQVYYLPFEELI